MTTSVKTAQRAIAELVRLETAVCQVLPVRQVLPVPRDQPVRRDQQVQQGRRAFRAHKGQRGLKGRPARLDHKDQWVLQDLREMEAATFAYS